MTTRPLTYIIILNWNGWKDTVECVESCRQLSYQHFRILLVDNGSTDGSEGILRKRFPDIEFIQTGDNLGFAGGNNVGIRYALENHADFVWLLNNDTLVQPAALSALIETAELDSRAGIIGSKILIDSRPQYIWFAGGFWSFSKSLLTIRGENEKDSGQYERRAEVDFITGCSLLIRAFTIRDIGLLDERYFLYWEDTDWNAKARERGWKIFYSPQSVIQHKVSSSFDIKTDQQAYYYLRNKLLFYEQHFPAMFPVALLFALFGSLRFAVQGKTHFTKGYLYGFKDYCLRRFGKRWN